MFLARSFPCRTAFWALAVVAVPGCFEARSGTAASSPAPQASGTGAASVPTRRSARTINIPCWSVWLRTIGFAALPTVQTISPESNSSPVDRTT
jgi:hypothetical protein